MSEIPYITRLGDALESAIATTPVRAGRRRRVRTRWRAAVVVAMLATGGAATAAVVLQGPSPRTLAASGITCYGSTSPGGDMYADIEANGRSPVQACRQVFAQNGPAALAAAGAQLIACVKPDLGVVVLAADGQPNQCSREGLIDFAGSSYAKAQAGVDTLVRALTALGANRKCIAAPTLVSDVQAALGRLGWQGWRAAEQAPVGTSSAGTCGLFLGTGSTFSDPTASLDPRHHVVWVVSGPDPTVLALAGPLDLRLLRLTGQACYSSAAARALVAHVVERSGMSVRFDFTQEPPGMQSAYGQASYAKGCTIVGSLEAAPTGHTIDALLYAASAPAQPAGSSPRPDDFH